MTEPEAHPSWTPQQGPRAPRPWWQQILGQWPLFVVLVGVTVGVAWAGLGHWKRGSFTIGIAFAVGTLLRLVVPEARIGLLGVRRRWIDVLCLGLLGAGIITLSLIVPPRV